MNLLTVSTDLISIFLFTTLFLFFARKVAKKVGLVDKPNFRKRHQGLIPLVGGISVGNDSNLLIVFYVQRAFTDKQQIKRKAQSFD